MTSFFLAVYCKDDRIGEGNKIGDYRMHVSDDHFVKSSGRKDWKKDSTKARLEDNN